MSAAMLRALDAVNDRLILAEAIGQALDQVAGEEDQPLVLVYRRQVQAIGEACEALEELVRGCGANEPPSPAPRAQRTAESGPSAPELAQGGALPDPLAFTACAPCGQSAAGLGARSDAQCPARPAKRSFSAHE
ncbi:MAG: hypothetical protein NDJ19_00705 [Ramlibacter sp.]|nr:hypothetical protein [Ramlibacter sp.]